MPRRIFVVPVPPTMSEDVGERRNWGQEFNSWLPGEGLLQESVALAVIVFIALEAIIFSGFYLTASVRDAVLGALWFAPLVMAVAAIIALVLATYRVLRYERRERRYMEVLDLQVMAVRQQVHHERSTPDFSNSPQYTPVDSRYWDQLAYIIMKRYYDTLRLTRSFDAAARAMSRDACVSDGICSQEEWNVVNRLLIARGLRRGRKRGLVPRSFDEAWQLWMQKSQTVTSWTIDEKGRWIPKE